MDLNDTIVALSSAAGPGARAVIRLSGPASLRITQALFTSDLPVESSRRRLFSGKLQVPDLAQSLPADLLVWPGPRSYTGQDMAELHFISSPPLIELIVATLLNTGARAAKPGEFTLRAFLNGKRDLPQSEAVQAVIGAESRDELKLALGQLAGGVTRPLEGLREDLLNLLADVEAGLDFTEENIQFVGHEDLLHRLAKGLAQFTTLKRQLDHRSASERPFRAVLVGEPNVGKSSLFNALGGRDEALVSAIPGTTRDYLVKRLEIDGATIELADTAGWQLESDSIESQAQALGRNQARLADMLLICIESGRPMTSRETGMLADRDRPTLGIATKCDLAEPAPGLLATSAATGVGLSELKSKIVARVRARGNPALAPSLSRCRHHVDAGLEHLRRAHAAVLFSDPPEVLALELRGALDELGAMVGAVYTDDLLDRIFSRFCIGK
jgi:tRNA modification GTPase